MKGRLPARLPLLLVGVFACSAPPGGVTGTWKGHATDPRGQSVDLNLSLRAEGNTVTGTVAGPGSLDAAPAIENGRIAGDQVSFEIRIKSHDGRTAAFAFAVKVSGDRMQGSVTSVGEGRSIPFTATRTSASATVLRPSAPATDTQPPDLHGTDPTPQDAQAATLAAFARYEVVGLGILSYSNQDFDDFILALLRNPALPGKVNDIVVECGNALYQPVLDRYIAGEELPLAEVRQVWRNTTQPFCGVSAFYDELFPLVRRINRTLPPERRLRVLAGDPPLDWSKVERREDLLPFLERDSSIASVMEKEVLAKHRRALMIFGLLHLMHGGGAVGMYEARGFPNVTFVVMAHNGFGNDTPLSKYNDALERRLASWRVPSLVSLKGTWLDDLGFRYLFPDVRGADRVSDRVDGYLYLGPRDVLLNERIQAAVILDTAYMAELSRRAEIGGGSVGAGAVLREAADSSVFFNGPAEAPPGMARSRVTRHK